jgi:hypothetical protein
MAASLSWTPLPHPSVEILGLPFLVADWPHLWRLPAAQLPQLPAGVGRQAVFPAGGRLRLTTDSSTLCFRGRAVSAAAQGSGLDLYVDGDFWRGVGFTADGPTEICCFEGAPRRMRQIDLYLPVRQEIQVSAVGIDDGDALAPPPGQVTRSPVVLYGSSVAQGAGASRPGMAYGAQLSRCLGTDVVNLGFGGAGKAEPEVVELVGSAAASCFLFDLGKSYGRQAVAPYADMLAGIRSRHPDTPMVCVTPIYSTREAYSSEYAELSQYTRDVVRRAVAGCQAGGCALLSLVEGQDLLGPDDADGLSADGVHPGDLGFTLITQRLAPVLREALDR